jgi:hypothetical protein
MIFSKKKEQKKSPLQKQTRTNNKIYFTMKNYKNYVIQRPGIEFEEVMVQNQKKNV